VSSEANKGSLRLAARFAQMRALLSAFRSNTRANVAVITAVSAIPLISAIGCVVDYTTAAMIRTKLQAAADAATLAAVSANSPLRSDRHHRLHDFHSDGHCDQKREDHHRDFVLFGTGSHVLHGRDWL